jgi:hypothetical protein
MESSQTSSLVISWVITELCHTKKECQRYKPQRGGNCGYTKVTTPSFPPGYRINIPPRQEFLRLLAAECVPQASI